MAIVFTVDYTGTPDENDRLAAKHIIEQENARLASLEPPQPPLPYATDAELKSSYLGYWDTKTTNAHADYARQAKAKSYSGIKDLWDQADDATRDQVIALLTP